MNVSKSLKKSEKTNSNLKPIPDKDSWLNNESIKKGITSYLIKIFNDKDKDAPIFIAWFITQLKDHPSDLDVIDEECCQACSSLTVSWLSDNIDHYFEKDKSQ